MANQAESFSRPRLVDRAEGVGPPHVPVRGLRGQVGDHRDPGADVEEHGPGQLYRGGPPVDPAGLEDEEPPPGAVHGLRSGVHGFPVGQEPGRGEEQRADKKGHGVPAGPDGTGVAGDRAEREQQRPDGEQDGDPPAPGPGRPPGRPGRKGARGVLAVAAGVPARHGAVRADALDVGHERADTARLVFLVLLHGHRPVLSDRPGRPRRPGQPTVAWSGWPGRRCCCRVRPHGVSQAGRG